RVASGHRRLNGVLTRARSRRRADGSCLCSPAAPTLLSRNAQSPGAAEAPQCYASLRSAVTYVYLAAAALVLGPLVGYLGWRLVGGKPTLDRQLSLAAFGWGLRASLAPAGGVSFVYTGVSALYAAVASLAACFLCWHALNLRPRVLRFGVVALGAIPLVLGGCLGSVGFLGLALTIGEV